MKTLVGCVLGVAATAILSFAQGVTSERWKVFHSSTGFSVQYPASWFPKGISTDRLRILSSPGGAEGLIIKKGQAMIVAVKEEDYQASTMAKLIDYYTNDAEVLSRTAIHDDSSGSGGCSDLEEIISREDAVPAEDVPGPVPRMINTELFCELKNEKYVTILRNFEGDRKQPTYQRIVLRVAKSLRTDASTTK